VFRPDPTIPFVPATRDRVVALVESINQPQISIPSKPPQSVTGHLCGLRNPDGTFSLYVSLFLPQSAENVVYVHEPRELPLEGYREAEAEGLHFLESMGFMLDNLNFRNMGPELQQRTLERVPLFSRPRAATAAAAQHDRAVAAQAAVARFLSSF
jgi:hypothetical protein